MNKIEEHKFILNFEIFDQLNNDLYCRSKVYGGWLVRVSSNSYPYDLKSLVFIPDHNHEWKIE